MKSSAAKSLELAEAQRVDQVCERFEAAWLSGPRPHIETYLAEASERMQPVLIEELVALEAELRRHAGEAPTPQEYLSRFPDHAARIEALFRGTPELRTPAPADALSRNEVGASTPEFEPRLPNPCGEEPLPATSRYRPLRLHARGGLGEVLLAEDSELGRRVALKRIQPRHADHPESRRRFLREAEITARLEHPGIVPVHGLVHDANGQPSYAMRFIEGQSLKEAIARFHFSVVGQEGKLVPRPADSASTYHALPFRQLLGSFVAVCKTIAYAHSRSIIHRDLKPSNIMLGMYGETLVVDWGLAKSLEPSGTGTVADEPTTTTEGDSGEGTQPGMAMGTPAYMSPEQAAGQWDQVGPASDIYSLGATLYEILTGQPPYRGGSVSALEEVKQGTFAPPRQQKKVIPGSLEAICLKAMARQPKDRYLTALDLAADLEHWLADEPVSAWPEPWSVRAGRWVRRHRLAAATAVVVLLAAMGLAVIAAVLSEQGRQAVAHERDEKETQRGKAVAARDEARRVVELMASEGQLQILEKQATLTVEQETLLKALMAYYQRSVQEEVTEEREKLRQAEAYSRIAWLQMRLGYRQEAILAYRRAQEAWEKLTADFSVAPEHRHGLARTHINLGMLLLYEKPREAEAEFRQAQNQWQRLEAAAPAAPEPRQGMATCHNNQGMVLASRGQYTEAETEYRQALPRLEKLVSEYPSLPPYRQELAKVYNNLGALHERRGKADAAWPEYRRALDLFNQLTVDFPAVAEYRQDSAKGHKNLGVLLKQFGKRTEAEAELRRACEYQERLARDFPSAPQYRLDLAATRNSLGLLLAELGQPREAEAEYRGALDLQEPLTAQFPAVPGHALALGGIYCNYGNLMVRTSRPTESLAWFTQACATLQPVLAKEPRMVNARRFLCTAYWGRAEALYQLGRHAEAMEDWSRALDLDDLKQPGIRLGHARSLARTDHYAQAVFVAEELTKVKDIPGDALCDCARIFSLASVAVNRDSALPDQYAARAVTLLRQAHSVGYFKEMAHLVALKKDADMAPLQGREDFQKLLADLERK